MRRSGLLLLCLGLLTSASLSLASAAAAGVTCAFAQSGPGVLEISVVGETGPSGLLRRSGEEIEVISLDEGSHATEKIPCSGGTPTVSNTDTVAAQLVDGDFRLSSKGGAFAPGATAETDGTSEIEFTLQLEQSPTVFVSQTNGPDRVRLGRVGGLLGANLNAVVEAAPDVDLTLEGANLNFLQINARAGKDRVSGAGGPEFQGPFSGPLIEAGGKGNDILRAGTSPEPPLGALLVGGGGDDRLFGADGPDLLADFSGRNLLVGRRGKDTIDTTHGGIGRVFAGAGNDEIIADDEFFDPRKDRDRIDCGPGRDLLEADATDRTVRCESQRRSLLGRRY